MELKLKTLELRVAELERSLDEKDRELREVSINRAEFVQHLNTIYNLLRSTHKNKQSSKIVESIINIDKKFKQTKYTAEIGKEKAEESKKSGKKPTKHDLKVIGKGSDKKKNILDILEPDRLEFLGKYSYRERMILMNRIDIYRLFITIIIISSEIKYPRVLTNIEEKELKEFINELTEFENLVLDLNLDENVIWEKGKVCEKQALQLFSRFFNL